MHMHKLLTFAGVATQNQILLKTAYHLLYQVQGLGRQSSDAIGESRAKATTSSASGTVVNVVTEWGFFRVV